MTDQHVAIVHERFTEIGGSERVVEQLHALWPDAPVHAPIVDVSALPAGLRSADIRSSSLQRLYRGGPDYAHLLPLLPAAIERLDLSGAEVVITSHHAFANRVRIRPGARLVSYTHTPARWMWEPSFLVGEWGGRLGHLTLSAFARRHRQADVAAARRADMIVANSRHVAMRIRRWWGREATVVPPPVDVERFTPDPSVAREGFFLFVGRLVPYKRPHIAVAAAQRAGVPLVVAGGGRMRAVVAAGAGPRTEILGRVDDATLLDLYRRCQALLYPGEEDFGIVPVEAQACGAPVVALGAGGVLDSVLDGITGTFYRPAGPADEVDALAAALRSFDPARFEPRVARSHAEGFGPGVFRSRFARAVEPVLASLEGTALR
ncbi:MAG: glycosyltransferase [Actinomycetota bacterium]|nr:glycosyltransferase [Actinomycetota bacterium]